MEMVEEVGKSVESLRSLSEDARKLDMHYIPSRYPNVLPGGTPHRFYSENMAEEALASSRKLFEAVEAYFNDEGEIEILAEF
jgi:HEPN domain-containing protein